MPLGDGRKQTKQTTKSKKVAWYGVRLRLRQQHSWYGMAAWHWAMAMAMVELN